MGRGSDIRVVDPVLTNLLRGYSNAEFVGVELFPIVENSKETGKIPTFGKEAFKAYVTKRGLRGKTNVLPVEARATVDLALEEHDAAYPVDYREPEEDIIDTEEFGAYLAQEAIMMEHEIDCATQATTAANYPTGSKATLSGSSQFSHADSHPIVLIKAAMETVRGKIGRKPNTILMGSVVFDKLAEHPDFIDRIKYTQRGIMTAELMATILGVEKVVVGASVYADDDGTMHDIWSDFLVLAYVAPAKGTGTGRSKWVPSFGYTIRKRGMPQGDRYDAEGGKVKMIRSTDNYQVKIVGADAGYLMSDCIA